MKNYEVDLPEGHLGSHADVLFARLFGKVKIGDDCWIWLGAKDSKGYGRMYIPKNARGERHWTGAHRVSYELANGPIPTGLSLDHLCRTPLCVKPTHLEAVTHRENVRRGNGWSGRHARTTHCPRGHEYTPENTRTDRLGRRSCHACRIAKDRAHYNAVLRFTKPWRKKQSA